MYIILISTLQEMGWAADQPVKGSRLHPGHVSFKTLIALAQVIPAQYQCRIMG
jgi:hypothetical protein